MNDSIALWAMVHNEADRLGPWIRYHRALGVGPIILFADGCTDETVDVARGFDDVWIFDLEPRPVDQRLSIAQTESGLVALERARTLGCDWLLAVDVDEFAWGGSPAELRSACTDDVREVGRLQRLIESVSPNVEQIRLETLETIPLRVPLGQRFFATTWVQHGQPYVRSLGVPPTGEPRLIERFLGHQLGKSLVRVGSNLVPDGPHRWYREDGSEPETVHAGLHLHYFVADLKSWALRWRRRVHLGDTWDGAIERPYPHNEWRDFVATSTVEEQRRYYETSVAVNECVLEPLESDTLFKVDVVPLVLDACKATQGRPLVFIGLDCFDPDLFDEWRAKGLLPRLSDVDRRAARLDTVGPKGTFVSAVWPDMFSGVGAGKHGNQCWKMLRRGSYEFDWHRIRLQQTRRVFWDALDQAGYDCALVDVPLTPGWAANGLQVFEWGNHDRELGFAAYPDGLDREVRELVGHHGVEKACNQFDRTPAEIADFRDRLVKGARDRTTLMLDMLRRDRWDLFFGVFSESHCVGHQSWHYHDETSPKWPADSAAAVGDPVLAVYRGIDAALGEFLDGVDEEATVAVWMSHGMGPHTYPTYLNDGILLELDMQRHQREVARAEQVERLSGTETRVRRRPKIDDTASRLFFDHMNNDPESGVRLNVSGREPAGLINPGRDFDNMCDWLAGQYYAMVDAETGEPLVDEVFLASELYEGPYLADLPDIFVRWRRRPEFVLKASVNGAEVEAHPTSCRTGDHHPRGRLYVYGPGMKQGRVEMDSPLQCRDITALVCDYFGVDMDIDGTIDSELSERLFGPRSSRGCATVSSHSLQRRPTPSTD